MPQRFKDTDDILLVDEPKTYDFLENCIKAASEPFRTKRIHIGMDETFQLGLGKYLEKHGYEKHIDLMNRHLQKVIAITEKLGLKPMIWSDMYLPLFAENSNYKMKTARFGRIFLQGFRRSSLFIGIITRKNKKCMNKIFKTISCSARTPIFAGGAWTWNGLAPNYGKAIATTEAATGCL